MKLWNKYKVTSIPSLVFVDGATGKVVCRNGLLVVRDDPKGEIGGRHVEKRTQKGATSLSKLVRFFLLPLVVKYDYAVLCSASVALAQTLVV